MTYIKINKPSLDYDQFSDFHVFTMNNFVRNVMKNGKYKKAMRIVRLGLLFGLKKLYYKIRLNDGGNIIPRRMRVLKRTTLTTDILDAQAVREINDLKLDYSEYYCRKDAAEFTDFEHEK